MREPNLEAVNRALSVTNQKQADDLKKADRRLAALRRVIIELAELLDRAGYPTTAEQAREAANV